ncbi:MAG: TldD/PmbA family protein [Acidobacteria bacterium]|nr:TldD/PmbA family protein [Acidobacteriota bacterium]
MNEFAAAALDAARSSGATYADVRVARIRSQRLISRGGDGADTFESERFGAGLRVLVDGGRGFAATPRVEIAEAPALAARAVSIARANRQLRRSDVVLARADRVRGVWQTPITKDPFRVPLEPKIDLLLAICRAALEVKGATFCEAGMGFVREEIEFASSEGTTTQQVVVRSHPWFLVTSVDPATGECQTRRSLAPPSGLGYEGVESYPWLDEARTAAEEAVMKHEAATVEPGRRAVVLHPSNLWLTIHESIGHATEIDRILGYEANFAGTSFVRPEDRGSLRYASEIVNVDADRVQEGGLATVGFDDDGVPARRWPLIEEGVLVDFQSTREEAGALGLPASHGCSHAASWDSVPLLRMPNVSLRPGSAPIGIPEAIAATEDGIYIVGDGSFSIDQQRRRFQFGGQTFWEIRGGRIARMLKDAACESGTLDFWRSCDLIGGEASYELGGAFADGKGDPEQPHAVSHGCPVARFRGVSVVNTPAGGARR